MVSYQRFIEDHPNSYPIGTRGFFSRG